MTISVWLHPKTEPVKAWQHVTDAPLPTWVAETTRRADDGALLLVRASGTQEVKPGEWIIRRMDGETFWYTDAMRRRDFK